MTINLFAHRISLLEKTLGHLNDVDVCLQLSDAPDFYTLYINRIQQCIEQGILQLKNTTEKPVSVDWKNWNLSESFYHWQ